MKKELTHARLCELLYYNPNTGAFIRRVRSGNQPAGKALSALHADGYLHTRISGKSYLLHRLAWFYVHGSWPDGILDHIDGDRQNNSLRNIREATRGVNAQNRKHAHSNNRAGVLGVSFMPRGNPNCWRAEIMVGGQRKYLGGYPTKQAAHEAYLVAKRQLHPGCTI